MDCVLRENLRFLFLLKREEETHERINLIRTLNYLS